MSRSHLVALGEIAEISIGYQHREKVSHSDHGTHRMIQGKDLFRSDSVPGGSDQPAVWRIGAETLDRVTPKGGGARYGLLPGDVLFVSRGTNNVAVPLNKQTVQPYPESWDDLIAAYTYYILRPDQSRVLPEYLAWFINQPPAQSFLAQQSRGTLAKLLPKNVFEELEVSLPSLDRQLKIVEIEQLRVREEGLLKQLIAARQRLVQHACLAAATSEAIPHSTPN